MREPNESTIPLRISQSDILDKKTEPLPKEKLGWKMRRPTVMAILIVLMLSVGWGTWSFWGSPSNVDDDQSIVEIDGFESAPVFIGAPSQEGTNESGSRDAGTLIAAPGFDGTLPTRSPTMNTLLTNEQLRSADVWLTGTIEEAEPKERIELPQRISDSPSKSTIVR